MRHSSGLAIRTEIRGEVCWVVLAGELTLAEASDFREWLRVFLQEEEQLAVDLTALSFLDSSGTAVLLGAARQLKARSLRVRLKVLPRQQRMLAMLGLDQVFDLEP